MLFRVLFRYMIPFRHTVGPCPSLQRVIPETYVCAIHASMELMTRLLPSVKTAFQYVIHFGYRRMCRIQFTSCNHLALAYRNNDPPDLGGLGVRKPHSSPNYAPACVEMSGRNRNRFLCIICGRATSEGKEAVKKAA